MTAALNATKATNGVPKFVAYVALRPGCADNCCDGTLHYFPIVKLCPLSRSDCNGQIDGGVMEEMFAPFMRFGDFSGRSRRMEYWLYTVFHSVVLILLIVGMFSFPRTGGGLTGMSDTSLNFLTLAMFWVLLTLIPTLAVTVRRLHDANFSGWLLLIQFVPLGGLALLIMLLMPGTKGPNTYGHDPRGGNEEFYWWENETGPPEGAPARTARTVGGDASHRSTSAAYSSNNDRAALAGSRQFGRRAATPTYHTEAANTERASASREAWLRRMEGR
jgi:uncharacterized membrane protein YhaH (DUF805 family)